MSTIPSGNSRGTISDYRLLGERRREIYGQFGFGEATDARFPGFPLVCLAVLALAWELFLVSPGVIREFAELISSAAFAGPGDPSVRTGLPPKVYTFVVFILILMAICVLIVLTYAGYFRNPKDERAAVIVEHFAVGVIGFVLGQHF